MLRIRNFEHRQHRAAVCIERISGASHARGKRPPRPLGHAQLRYLARRDRADIALRHIHENAQHIDLRDAEDFLCRAVAGADQRSNIAVDVSRGDDAVERRGDARE